MKTETQPDSAGKEKKCINYIFAASAGRSGSKYLASLFTGHNDAVVFYEGKPRLNKAPMRAWLKGNPLPMQQALLPKLKVIKHTNVNNRLYVETNHAFIKGYGWEVMKFLPEEEVAVIVLERDAAEIAKSFYRIGVNPLNQRGADSLITPCKQGIWVMGEKELSRYKRNRIFARLFSAVNSVFGRKLPDPLKAYKLELLETYARLVQQLTEDFFIKHPSVTRVNATMEELKNTDFVKSLCHTIGVSYTKGMEEKIIAKANEKKRKQ
jgi:hypothetical protein